MDEDARSRRVETIALDNILSDDSPNGDPPTTRAEWFRHQDSWVGLITREMLVLAALPSDRLQVDVVGRETPAGKLKW